MGWLLLHMFELEFSITWLNFIRTSSFVHIGGFFAVVDRNPFCCQRWPPIAAQEFLSVFLSLGAIDAWFLVHPVPPLHGLRPSYCSIASLCGPLQRRRLSYPPLSPFAALPFFPLPTALPFFDYLLHNIFLLPIALPFVFLKSKF